MVKCKTERPVLTRQWIVCPVCQRKLALCVQGAKVFGVFVKCPKCREEIELNTPE
nr:MAG TPA: Transcription initiation factor IIE, alpha FINGER, Transcription [Caudoviricetes sp.]